MTQSTHDAPVAVVTGSSRGLGRAFAAELARTGHRVVVNATTEEGAARAVAELASSGAEAVSAVGSVADAAFCEHLVETAVSAFGRIDVLVNNAGITRDRSFLKMSVEEFDEVVATHLRGTWACARAAARRMTDRGGSIVNVSSGSGLFGMYGQANYAAAKAGIVGLGRVMHLELFARFGIRTNTLAPAAATDMTKVFASSDVGHAVAFPSPDAVAPIVSYLAGAESRDVSGQVLSFDGSVLSVWTHPEAAHTWTADAWTAADFAERLTPDRMQAFHPDRWGSGVTAG
ncbi:SDR family NAD(P)-dependent oxidoreductase [Microbacterium sp. No. 7]|uniref:SDR family NAD(P)-dependent oxidoreductase n=1 Tax=Microbacterium sp. No. 7 TaxID=1714373 RepID=UPI0006CF2258|nr:SDR family NAD(P)-dependent oxidoreductase [Microbacterium sp. No. 7]ALJ21871.1 hypothetical protein AOA12_19005 [Microbacterium sp. No. 7]